MTTTTSKEMLVFVSDKRKERKKEKQNEFQCALWAMAGMAAMGCDAIQYKHKLSICIFFVLNRRECKLHVVIHSKKSSA